MSKPNRVFVDEFEHMLDGFRLGRKIFDAGFRPTFIVGLWRGGSPVGIVVQECFAALGIETDHIALRTSYQGRKQYEQTIASRADIRVHGRQYLLEQMTVDDRLLIVDDVFSSGRHTHAVIETLRKGLKRNMPEEVRVATTWWRHGEGRPAESPRPDFFLHETSDWLVLPYEMDGLTLDEIAEHKPFLLPMLERCGVDARQS